jgi:c-di-AMP phosphodiesterase-like protein
MSDFNTNFIGKILSKVKIYLIIIIILSIFLCVYDIKWIIPAIVLNLLLIIYTFWENGRKKNELVNHIEELTMDVSTASKSTLVNSPIPLVLIKTDGNIIWRSKKFTEVFSDDQMNTYLNPIVKEIKLDIENTGSQEFLKQFNINGKTYQIRGAISNSKKRDRRKQKEYVLILYFIDETKYNELFDKYNNSTTCIGIATIDNYDEILQRALPEEKIKILAEIEKMIMDSASTTGGLIVKNERNMFIYIVEQQYISKMEKSKFNILDQVKTIETTTKIPTTISIAITNDGKTLYEKYKNAMASMEIVLGRGGDQAVVRRDGKYKFFGGKTLETEKRTKVKARNIAKNISIAMKEASDIMIMGHKNIDIDAIGSALGIYRLARNLEKTCHIVSEPTGDSLGKFWEELIAIPEYSEVILNEEDAIKEMSDNTLLIIVDTHKVGYVEFPNILNAAKHKVIIDHHRKSPDFISDAELSFHEVYASSTSELVTELIQYAKEDIELSLIEAESLYGGIMVDTKNFTFKTGVRTFEAAAYLRKFGVDIIKVKKWFQADLSSYNEISEIVRNAEIIEDNIAISICKREDENTGLICAKAADELLTISNITASFVMGKVDDKITISGRSIGDINVQVILEKLGGGGHITLAGAQLEGFTMEEAHDELIIRINEYLAEVT